jgi:hypothetical protein
MDFVVLLKFRSSVSAAEADAGLGRRAAWKYPEGVQVIAEIGRSPRRCRS